MQNYIMLETSNMIGRGAGTTRCRAGYGLSPAGVRVLLYKGDYFGAMVTLHHQHLMGGSGHNTKGASGHNCTVFVLEFANQISAKTTFEIFSNTVFISI